MLISSKNTLTETPSIVFDHIVGHCGPPMLTCKINHHNFYLDNMVHRHEHSILGTWLQGSVIGEERELCHFSLFTHLWASPLSCFHMWTGPGSLHLRSRWPWDQMCIICHFFLPIILVRFLERIIYTHFFHFLMYYSLTFSVWLLSPLTIPSSQIQWEPWPSIPHPLKHWTLSLSPHWKPFLPWLIRSTSPSVQFNSL